MNELEKRTRADGWLHATFVIKAHCLQPTHSQGKEGGKSVLVLDVLVDVLVAVGSR